MEDDANPLIEVVAGVICDARDRILLARRTEGRDLAGLWEFPGGKREPGESAEAALARELHEELGIKVEVGAPLIAVPQAYPHKRLRLDVRRIRTYRGTPKGLDGQALAWVPPHKLASYAMPPADRPVVAALRQPDHYLVTPLPEGAGDAAKAAANPSLAGTDKIGKTADSTVDEASADAAWLAQLDLSLAAGVRRLQLRLPGLDHARRHRLVGEAAKRAAAAGAEVLVNGDADLAREFGIGLHLPAAQLLACSSRPVADGVILAASCHDAAELQAAERLGCDFAVLGPVQPTATHPDAKGLGWDRFARLRELVSLPLYAIGGLTPADLAEARQHGAQGIAAIRSLWPSGSLRDGSS